MVSQLVTAVPSLHKPGKIFFKYQKLKCSVICSNIWIFHFCICSSKTGKLKTTYKHENVSATADFDLSLSAGPLIYTSAVVGYQGKFKYIHE